MDVKLIKENPDGSADYFFNMNDEEKNALLALGIITALKRGIEEGNNYVISGSEVSTERTPCVGNTKCGESDCVYGPCVKSGKSELQCVCDQITKVPY